MSLPGLAGNGTAEAILPVALPRGRGVISLLSLVSDGATESMLDEA
jgi:hypothetical protein